MTVVAATEQLGKRTALSFCAKHATNLGLGSSIAIAEAHASASKVTQSEPHVHSTSKHDAIMA